MNMAALTKVAAGFGIVLASVLLFAGCTMVGPKYKPPTATVAECSSITATGVDERTGERITLDEANALTTWSAVRVEDGRWRLYEAEPKGPGTC